MGEKNTSKARAPLAWKGKGNPRGRPPRTQCLKLEPKPRSIVSQILEDMINRNKITIPFALESESKSEDQTPVNCTESILSDDSNQSEEFTNQGLKKKTKSNIEETVTFKLYKCNFANCMYSTKLSSNLEKHKRTHTGEKPYLCDRCSFRTSFSNSLKVHKRLHTKERPYACKHCDYKCNSTSNLKKHCLTKHKDNITAPKENLEQ